MEKNKNNILTSSIGYPLNKDFIAQTDKFESFLRNLKSELDSFDELNQSKNIRIEKLIKIKASIFNVLNDHFKSIWEIVSFFSKIEFNYHQKYYQKKLLPLLSTPPLNKRIYDKPLGYPGDYIMMNYYYDDSYEGDSTYEMLLHRYTLEIPVARAHINRKNYFINKIKVTAANSPDKARIASFGCGPAREIIEFIKNDELATNCIFSCVDAETLALQQIKDKIAIINRKGVQIFYYPFNLLGIIRKSKTYDTLRNQDLLYAAGLFDYFNDNIARRILKNMYSFLSDNGTLIIVNVSKTNSSRAYMELLGEWYLNLRNEHDLLALADDIKDAKEIKIDKDSETGENLYLIIKK